MSYFTLPKELSCWQTGWNQQISFFISPLQLSGYDVKGLLKVYGIPIKHLILKYLGIINHFYCCDKEYRISTVGFLLRTPLKVSDQCSTPVLLHSPRTCNRRFKGKVISVVIQSRFTLVLLFVFCCWVVIVLATLYLCV